MILPAWQTLLGLTSVEMKRLSEMILGVKKSSKYAAMML
jgi:hypothetical protein